MSKFNHAYSVGFEVTSGCEDASDVTADMLVSALLRRLALLTSGDPAEGSMLDAADLFDTMEEDDDEGD